MWKQVDVSRENYSVKNGQNVGKSLFFGVSFLLGFFLLLFFYT